MGYYFIPTKFKAKDNALYYFNDKWNVITIENVTNKGEINFFMKNLFGKMVLKTVYEDQLLTVEEFEKEYKKYKEAMRELKETEI